MNAVLTPPSLSARDDLGREDAQEGRNEHLDGEIDAMTGARVNHNLITGNAYAALRHDRPRPLAIGVAPLYDGVHFGPPANAT